MRHFAYTKVGSKLVLASVIFALLGQLACATNAFTRSIETYEAGRYPEALRTLRRLEDAALKTSIDSWSRYCLYRGLSELAVGNACQAQGWLSTVKALAMRHPEALSRGDRGRLEAAWRSLGKMPGEVD